MQARAPAIYSPSEMPPRRMLVQRGLALGVALGCLSVLLIAAHLVPSHSGEGSHQGLGMPPCQFLQHTGLPCPSCGMTTSFCWFVRGNLLASLYVQPMGTVLAVLCCCGLWTGLYIALTGRPVYRLLSRVPGSYLFVPLLAFAIAAWGWKIFLHLNGHDGW